MQSKAKNISLANTTLIIKITFAIITLDVTDLLDRTCFWKAETSIAIEIQRGRLC